jgi:hypothetical protein
LRADHQANFQRCVIEFTPQLWGLASEPMARRTSVGSAIAEQLEVVSRVASTESSVGLVVLVGEAVRLIWILAVCRGALYRPPFSLLSFYSP